MFMRKLRFGPPDHHGFVEVEIVGTVDPDTFDRLMEIFRAQVEGPGMIVTTRESRYGRTPNASAPRLETIERSRELPPSPTKALPPGPRIIDGEFDEG